MFPPTPVSAPVPPSPPATGDDPLVIIGPGNTMFMDCRVAAATCIVAVDDTEPDVAVRVAVPRDTAVTWPEVALTAATAGLLDIQVTLLEISELLPSLKVPVAKNA